MDSYHEIDTIKIEKQKAMQRYQTFRKIANIVRTLEIVVAILIISYSISVTTSYFPAVVEFTGKFLRRISSLLFSPHFVFLIGNAIIITLFAKYAGEKNSSDNAGDGEGIFGEVETSTAFSVPPAEVKIVPVAEEIEKPEEKTYMRTQSAVEMVVVKVDEKKELRRSVTEVRREIRNGEKSPRKRENRRFEEDGLSSEEFRRKVEAFIERQQRSLREERLAVVVSN